MKTVFEEPRCLSQLLEALEMCGKIGIFLFHFLPPGGSLTIEKVTREMNNFSVIAFQVRDKD